MEKSIGIDIVVGVSAGGKDDQVGILGEGCAGRNFPFVEIVYGIGE